MTISLTDPYTEENPAARKIKTEKKEEDISANLLKKIHRKKIHSQLPALYPFGFAAGRGAWLHGSYCRPDHVSIPENTLAGNKSQ
jgi:hypothetical protein